MDGNGNKRVLEWVCYLRQLECRKWGNFWQLAPLSPHSGKTRRRPVSSASSTMSPDDYVGECVEWEEDQELMANGSEEESIHGSYHAMTWHLHFVGRRDMIM